MAYLAIRAGNIKLHQQWMIRSYALTLAGVTLRLQLVAFQRDREPRLKNLSVIVQIE